MPKCTQIIIIFMVSFFGHGSIGCWSGNARVQDDSDAADAGMEQMNSMMLEIASLAALQTGDLEDAGFLFLVSQARFQIDKVVYPPLGKGGDSPGVLKAAMSAMLGPSMLKNLADQPDVFLKVIARLEAWSPEFAADYDPGWEYEGKLDAEDTKAAVAAYRATTIPPLRKQAKLLANEEYRDALAKLREATNEKSRISAMWTDHNDKLMLEEFRAAYKHEQAMQLKLIDVEWELIPESRWHAKLGWKAEDYFDDAGAIKLCRAIEANDLEEMKRLIADGVDVNSPGKNGMTLLLWAYPDHKLERFEILLAAGADPNVMATSGFGIGNRRFNPVPWGMMQTFHDSASFGNGSSINLMVCRTDADEYFYSVMRHGGDVNQTDPRTGETPLEILMEHGLYLPPSEKVQVLIENGADVNRRNPHSKRFPLETAVGRDGLAIAIALLKAGADPVKNGDSQYAIAESMLRDEANSYSEQGMTQYTELYQLLVERGVDFEKARQRLNNGPAWGKARAEQDRLKSELRSLEFQE